MNRPGKVGDSNFPGAVQFGTFKGTPMSASNYSRRIFKPLMKSLGLDFKTHDLRKMYGSFLIAQGENILSVSRLMGHSTPSVTLDIYAKVVIESNVSGNSIGVITISDVAIPHTNR